jgi:hypothetical protein
MRLDTSSNFQGIQRKLYLKSKVERLKGLWRAAIGKPDEGNLHVRIDEGLLETCGTSRGAPATYSARWACEGVSRLSGQQGTSTLPWLTRTLAYWLTLLLLSFMEDACGN